LNQLTQVIIISQFDGRELTTQENFKELEDIKRQVQQLPPEELDKIKKQLKEKWVCDLRKKE
jgi:hypothetical protein